MAVTTEKFLSGTGLQGGSSEYLNVGYNERIASAIAGGLFLACGMKRGGITGLLSAVAGGALLYRGYTGHCDMYEAMGWNTAKTSEGEGEEDVWERGIKVEHCITINKSPADLYRFWRDFENLPKFMKHVESVKTLGPSLSHWVVQGPAGTKVEWSAEVINDIENEKIAWKSLEEADVDSAGSVTFKPAKNGQGTDVEISLQYRPPAGKAGAMLAKVFGQDPANQIEDDMQRFKQLCEAGEIPTTTGQPAGQMF